ncbi:MAG: hypothetical protein ACRDG3_12170 [Tepidiformaceae bacterium]
MRLDLSSLTAAERADFDAVSDVPAALLTPATVTDLALETGFWITLRRRTPGLTFAQFRARKNWLLREAGIRERLN